MNKKFNFCLFIGEGHENEDTFELLKSSRADDYIDKEGNKFPCRLFKLPSAATYYIDDTP